MMKDQASVETLEWDSAHFGFPIGSIDSIPTDTEQWNSIHLRIKKKKLKCVYLYLPEILPELVSKVLDQGFQYVGSRLDLECRKTQWKQIPKPQERNMHIRPAETKDIESLLEIASLSHRDTRFVCDKNFPREKVKDLYRRWVARDFQSSNYVTLVAVSGDELAGYITAKIPESDRTGKVSLFAVPKKFRGQGIGALLLCRLQKILFDQQGCDSIIAPTQGNALVAHRLYQKSGFVSTKFGFWFHSWPVNGLFNKL